MKNRTLAASALLMLTIMAASAGPWQLSLSLKSAVVLVFALGWPSFLGIPARKTLATVIGLVGLISVVIVQFSPGPEMLGWLAPVMALGVGVVFVVQLIRGTGQSHRLESVFASVAGVVLAASGAGWVAILRLSGGFELLSASVASVFVVALLSMTPWPDRVVVPLGLVAGALAALLVAVVSSGTDALVAALVIGLMAAAILLGFRRIMMMHRPPREALSQLAVGATPILALGAMAYFTGRLFLLG